MNRRIKSCQRWFLTLFLLAVLAFVPVRPAQAATANEKTVFSFLTDTMGLSPAAACGVMSNIKCESGFQANISGMGGGYGLCQWSGVRKTRLYNWCQKKGYNASTLKGQMYYLQYELKTCYPKVLNYLRAVKNTSSGAYNAGYYWCYHFEAPANIRSTSSYRGSLAQSTYWKNMGASAVYVTSTSVSGGIRLSWNAGSQYGYHIQRSKKFDGSYETVASVSGSRKNWTDKTAELGQKYYYCVVSLDAKGEEAERSNRTSCIARPALEDSVCRIKLAKTEYTYTGKSLTPKVTVSYDGEKLISGTDYTVTCGKNKNAGTASVRVAGKGNYCGAVTLTFKILKAEQTIKASSIRTAFTGSKISIKASASGKGKLSYRVEAAEIASVKSSKLTLKRAGVTKITIKAAATANYKAASRTITLTVLPPKMTVSGLSSSKAGAVTVKWKAVKWLDGYEVQYTGSGRFTSASGVSQVTSGAKTSKLISGLKKGKVYLFRIRGYRIWSGKKLYGSWSPAKKIRVKK